jgi:hypothetical protein
MMKAEQNESIILKQRVRKRDVDFIKWRHASPGGVMAQRQLRHSKGQREGGGGRGEEEFSQGSERPSFVTNLLGDRPREYLTGADLLVLGSGVVGGAGEEGYDLGGLNFVYTDSGARRLSPNGVRRFSPDGARGLSPSGARRLSPDGGYDGRRERVLPTGGAGREGSGCGEEEAGARRSGDGGEEWRGTEGVESGGRGRKQGNGEGEEGGEGRIRGQEGGGDSGGGVCGVGSERYEISEMLGKVFDSVWGGLCVCVCVCVRACVCGFTTLRLCNQN